MTHQARGQASGQHRCVNHSAGEHGQCDAARHSPQPDQTVDNEHDEHDRDQEPERASGAPDDVGEVLIRFYEEQVAPVGLEEPV